MRKLTIGLAVLAVVAAVLLLRVLLGTLVVLLKAGVVLGIGAVIIYAGYQLYSGWTAAR